MHLLPLADFCFAKVLLFPSPLHVQNSIFWIDFALSKANG
jgi:hypothetical protein